MITVVPNTPEVHWLFADRSTVEWEVLRKTVTIGTEGRELDTGKRFYLDGNREWQEWSNDSTTEDILDKISETLEYIDADLKVIREGMVLHGIIPEKE